MALDYFDHTFNIAWGCVKVSYGCDNCYAEEDATCRNWNVWGKNAQRRTFGADYWKRPLKWDKEAKGAKKRPIVFCSSMADVFEKGHPTIDQERKKLWPLIEATPNLDWHLITKRHENIERNLPWGKTDVPWPNVWISVSVEDDLRARIRLPYVSRLNVVVRGAHIEPLLGPIPTLAQYISQLDWVLVGGESCDSNYAKARPMQPIWVKDINDICKGAGVPFMFKQWGSQKPVAVNADASIKFQAMNRFAAGDILFKKTWKGWAVPKVGKPR